MELMKYIGEATEYERKQEVEKKKVKNWLKTVSAFANTAGGILIFGISDDEEIIGLKEIEQDSEFISQKVKERISPFPEAVMELQNAAKDKTLLFLHIPAGSNTPYFYVGDGVMEAYIRIGNESVIANPTELKRLAMKGRNITYDMLVSPYRFEDFSFSKLRERYKSWTGNSMAEKEFDSFGIRDGNGQLTNAGALLADDSPIWWSRIFCTRWNGLDKSGGQVDALDSAEYSGSLIILLNEGMGFIKRNMKTIWKKLPDSRAEMPDYCDRSIFEALVNALIHRDYMINGSEVHIDIFDDRLVIYSPGGMPDGTQIQERNIETIPSTRRNPVLADIFSRIGYMERQGSGLGKICAAYESAANYQPGLDPVFRSNRAEFTVELPNLNYKASEEDAVCDALCDALSDALNVTLNQSERKILKQISLTPKVTQAELAENCELSRRTVQRYIKTLWEKGCIERSGSQKSGCWTIYSDILNDASTVTLNDTINVTLNKTEKQILEIIIGDNTVTQEEISETCSLTIRTIKRYIKSLVEKGYIERAGSKKSGHWVVRNDAAAVK